MDYTEVLKTWEVREMVNRMLGKDYTYENEKVIKKFISNSI